MGVGVTPPAPKFSRETVDRLIAEKRWDGLDRSPEGWISVIVVEAEIRNAKETPQVIVRKP